MFINCIGIFGYLSRAHIQQEIINSTQTTQVEITQTKLENEKSTIADIDTQIKQIDGALSKLTDQGKAGTSLAQAGAQRKQRQSLVDQKIQHQKVMEDLTKEKINADNANSKVNADFGPLLYIADLYYGKANQQELESTVRWIITILVFVFDPLALVLLVASQYAFQQRKKGLTAPTDSDNVMLYEGLK